MITHEEARERTLYLHGKYDEAYKTLNDYISQQEQLQAEHEALKRDIARYFELTKKMPAQSFEDYNEWNDLHDKLTKEIVITKCPKCGSKKITVEKRLFGNAECLDCKYYGKYAEFQEKLSKVGKEEWHLKKR